MSSGNSQPGSSVIPNNQTLGGSHKQGKLQTILFLIRDWFDWLFSLIRVGLAVIISLLVVTVFIFSLRDHKVYFNKISVPEGRNGDTLNSIEIVKKLKDEFDIILKGAAGGGSPLKSGPVHSSNTKNDQAQIPTLNFPDIDIPGIALSEIQDTINLVVKYLVEFDVLNPKTKIVSGAVVENENNESVLVISVNEDVVSRRKLNIESGEIRQGLFGSAIDVWAVLDTKVAARHLLRIEMTENVKNIFRELMSTMLTNDEKEDDSTAQLLLAVFYGKDNDLDAANKKFEYVQKEHPDEPGLYFYWGNYYYDQGDYAKAESMYRKSLEGNPKDTSVLNNLANSIWSQNRYEEAARIYERIVRIDAAHPTAYSGWGDALWGLEKYDQAMSKYQWAIEINPKNDSAYNGWGNCLWSKEEYDKAIGKYELAIAINKKNSLAYRGLGDSYWKKMHWDDAICFYWKAIDINSSSWAAYNGWGNVLYAIGDSALKEKNINEATARYRGAIEKYNLSIAYMAKNTVAFTGLGNAYWRLRMPDIAMQNYSQAIHIDPKNHLAYSGWGNALYDKGKFKEATAKYEKAIDLKPNECFVYQSLVNTYKELDDSEGIANTCKKVPRDCDLPSQCPKSVPSEQP